MKSLTNKAFVFIAVLVIIGVGVAMLGCSDKGGASPNRGVGSEATYHAIYDSEDNFIMSWGRSVDKDSSESAIIKVDGTYPLGHNYLTFETNITKPLPHGYIYREITQEQWNTLPTNEIGDIPDMPIHEDLWENKTTGVKLLIKSIANDIASIEIFIGDNTGIHFSLPDVSIDNLLLTLASGFERW